jgi:hypothetical protein
MSQTEMNKVQKKVKKVMDLLEKDFIPSQIVVICFCIAAAYIADSVKNTENGDSAKRMIELSKNSIEEIIRIALDELYFDDITDLIIRTELKFRNELNNSDE